VDGAHLVTGNDGGKTSFATLEVTSTTLANVLNGVSCPSAKLCLAVGNYTTSGGQAQTLTEKWNGSSWSIVSSPNTSTTQANVLSGVGCPSASFCLAVGDYTNSGGQAQTLTEKWNGRK